MSSFNTASSVGWLVISFLLVSSVFPSSYERTYLQKGNQPTTSLGGLKVTTKSWIDENTTAQPAFSSFSSHLTGSTVLIFVEAYPSTVYEPVPSIIPDGTHVVPQDTPLKPLYVSPTQFVPLLRQKPPRGHHHAADDFDEQEEGEEGVGVNGEDVGGGSLKFDYQFPTNTDGAVGGQEDDDDDGVLGAPLEEDDLMPPIFPSFSSSSAEGTIPTHDDMEAQQQHRRKGRKKRDRHSHSHSSYFSSGSPPSGITSKIQRTVPQQEGLVRHCHSPRYPCTLTDALRLANPHDTIRFLPGTYYGSHRITKTLTLEADPVSAVNKVVLSGRFKQRPLWFDGVPGRVKGLTFINGRGDTAGCLLMTKISDEVRQTDFITNCSFSGCVGYARASSEQGGVVAGAVGIIYRRLGARQVHLHSTTFSRNYARGMASAGTVLGGGATFRFGSLLVPRNEFKPLFSSVLSFLHGPASSLGHGKTFARMHEEGSQQNLLSNSFSNHLGAGSGWISASSSQLEDESTADSSLQGYKAFSRDKNNENTNSRYSVKSWIKSSSASNIFSSASSAQHSEHLVTSFCDIYVMKRHFTSKEMSSVAGMNERVKDGLPKYMSAFYRFLNWTVNGFPVYSTRTSTPTAPSAESAWLTFCTQRGGWEIKFIRGAVTSPDKLSECDGDWIQFRMNSVNKDSTGGVDPGADMYWVQRDPSTVGGGLEDEANFPLKRRWMMQLVCQEFTRFCPTFNVRGLPKNVEKLNGWYGDGTIVLSGDPEIDKETAATIDPSLPLGRIIYRRFTRLWETKFDSEMAVHITFQESQRWAIQFGAPQASDRKIGTVGYDASASLHPLEQGHWIVNKFGEAGIEAQSLAQNQRGRSRKSGSLRSKKDDQTSLPDLRHIYPELDTKQPDATENFISHDNSGGKFFQCAPRREVDELCRIINMRGMKQVLPEIDHPFLLTPIEFASRPVYRQAGSQDSRSQGSRNLFLWYCREHSQWVVHKEIPKDQDPNRKMRDDEVPCDALLFSQTTVAFDPAAEPLLWYRHKKFFRNEQGITLAYPVGDLREEIRNTPVSGDDSGFIRESLLDGHAVCSEDASSVTLELYVEPFTGSSASDTASPSSSSSNSHHQEDSPSSSSSSAGNSGLEGSTDSGAESSSSSSSSSSSKKGGKASSAQGLSAPSLRSIAGTFHAIGSSNGTRIFRAVTTTGSIVDPSILNSRQSSSSSSSVFAEGGEQLSRISYIMSFRQSCWCWHIYLENDLPEDLELAVQQSYPDFDQEEFDDQVRAQQLFENSKLRRRKGNPVETHPMGTGPGNTRDKLPTRSRKEIEEEDFSYEEEDDEEERDGTTSFTFPSMDEEGAIRNGIVAGGLDDSSDGSSSSPQRHHISKRVPPPVAVGLCMMDRQKFFQWPQQVDCSESPLAAGDWRIDPNFHLSVGTGNSLVATNNNNMKTPTSAETKLDPAEPDVPMKTPYEFPDFVHLTTEQTTHAQCRLMLVNGSYGRPQLTGFYQMENFTRNNRPMFVQVTTPFIEAADETTKEILADREAAKETGRILEDVVLTDKFPPKRPHRFFYCERAHRWMISRDPEQLEHNKWRIDGKPIAPPSHSAGKTGNTIPRWGQNFYSPPFPQDEVCESIGIASDRTTVMTPLDTMFGEFEFGSTGTSAPGVDLPLPNDNPKAYSRSYKKDIHSELLNFENTKLNTRRNYLWRPDLSCKRYEDSKQAPFFDFPLYLSQYPGGRFYGYPHREDTFHPRDNYPEFPMRPLVNISSTSFKTNTAHGEDGAAVVAGGLVVYAPISIIGASQISVVRSSTFDGNMAELLDEEPVATMEHLTRGSSSVNQQQQPSFSDGVDEGFAPSSSSSKPSRKRAEYDRLVRNLLRCPQCVEASSLMKTDKTFSSAVGGLNVFNSHFERAELTLTNSKFFRNDGPVGALLLSHTHGALHQIVLEDNSGEKLAGGIHAQQGGNFTLHSSKCFRNNGWLGGCTSQDRVGRSFVVNSELKWNSAQTGEGDSNYGGQTIMVNNNIVQSKQGTVLQSASEVPTFQTHITCPGPPSVFTQRQLGCVGEGTVDGAYGNGGEAGGAAGAGGGDPHPLGKLRQNEYGIVVGDSFLGEIPANMDQARNCFYSEPFSVALEHIVLFAFFVAIEPFWKMLTMPLVSALPRLLFALVLSTLLNKFLSPLLFGGYMEGSEKKRGWKRPKSLFDRQQQQKELQQQKEPQEQSSGGGKSSAKEKRRK